MSDEAPIIEGPGRCGTCDHWAENTGWIDLIPEPRGPLSANFKTTAHPLGEVVQKHNRDSGICTKVIEGWTWEEDQPLPLATCWDGSQYAAALHTHKTFGCVLWEPRISMLTAQLVDPAEA